MKYQVFKLTDLHGNFDENSVVLKIIKKSNVKNPEWQETARFDTEEEAEEFVLNNNKRRERLVILKVYE